MKIGYGIDTRIHAHKGTISVRAFFQKYGLDVPPEREGMAVGYLQQHLSSGTAHRFEELFENELNEEQIKELHQRLDKMREDAIGFNIVAI